jgi:hypothetical protein
MTLNLSEKVKELLEKNPEKRFTARKIASSIFETYPDECLKKQKRSTATVIPIDSSEALLQQIVAEIGSIRPRLQKKFPQIKTTEERPKKYYYTISTDETEVNLAENKNKLGNNLLSVATSFKEHDLYPKLSSFLQSELNLYSKRINEKCSSNKNGLNGNKWLYPDVVGMEDLSTDWNSEVKDCVKQYADKKTKLWSFEVKILINRSNVREAFFQTVSNSSWANLAYLVASEISGSDTMKELRLLSSLHGIGVIHLDAENPAESEILIPAKERLEIDWNNANRLAEENINFLSYIKLIRQFYQTGDVRAADWGIFQED